MSLVEAVTNVVVGYGIAVATQLIVFPAFGLRASVGDNLRIGAVFTVASLTRSYAVRRAFERWRALNEQSRANLDQNGRAANQRQSLVSSLVMFFPKSCGWAAAPRAHYRNCLSQSAAKQLPCRRPFVRRLRQSPAARTGGRAASQAPAWPWRSIRRVLPSSSRRCARPQTGERPTSARDTAASLPASRRAPAAIHAPVRDRHRRCCRCPLFPARPQVDPRLLQRGSFQMAQLFRIAHDIDAGDLAVADFERGRLRHAVGLDRDEARQPVDEAIGRMPRLRSGEDSGRAFLKSSIARSIPNTGTSAAGRLPAAVGVKSDIVGEQRSVAPSCRRFARRRRRPARSQPVFLRQIIARPRRLQVLARPPRQLTT